MAHGNREIDRRGFLGDTVRVAGAVGLVGAVGLRAALKGRPRDYVWQIDPDKCIACDKCQTLCVLEPSAVKCVQCFLLCGYCDVCTGYFPISDFQLDTAAESQLCPTGAITREFIDQRAGVRYFEYTIDEELCIGCGKCVKGCELMNGSLYMQVRHDLCVNCNECAIAVGCPAEAFYRVPPGNPVLLRKKAREVLQSKDRELSRQGSASVNHELRELLDKDAREYLDRRAQDG